jgi:ribonuclease P protein subunit POP4
MTLNTRNIYGHELIGLQVVIQIKSCHNSSAINGTIIDETKNMFTVMNKSGKIKLPKKEIKLNLTLPNQYKVTLDGKKLINRPEDRIKMFRRNQRLVT